MHECHFKNNIIDLVKEAGEQTALLFSINKQLAILSEKIECQQAEINALKNFKSNAKTIAVALGMIGSALWSFLQFVLNVFK